jgi:KaiC domain protein
MSDEEASGGDDWFDSAFEDEEDEFGTETATGEDEPGGAIDPEESLDRRTKTGSSFDPDRAFGESDSGGELFDDEAFGGFETGEDEALSSDIPRLDLGIKGLDDMIQGGVPRRHLIVTIGSAGTGKTTFGLQFLYHGLQNGENAIFITLEQSHESIINTANEWGWGFDSYEKQGSLAVVDLDPVEMANSLDNIQTELPRLIRDFGADRLVLDSVSLLEMMYEEQASRRTEVFEFTRSLKQAGVTTFLTSEASESSPYASRHGIIEYLTDAVFILQYVRGENQEARLAVEIQKIRNANHSREKKPYEITSDGLSVYQQANIF